MPTKEHSIRKGILKRSLSTLIVSLAILSVLTISFTSFQLYSEISKRNRQVIKSLSTVVNTFLSGVLQDISFLKEDMLVHNDRHTYHLKTFCQTYPAFVSAWLTDSTGMIQYASDEKLMLLRRDKSRTEGFQKIVREKLPHHYSQIALSSTSSLPSTTISVPFKKGVLSIEILTTKLDSVLTNISSLEGYSVTLTDQSSAWLHHPDNQKVLERQLDPLFRRYWNHKEKVQEYLFPFEGTLSLATLTQTTDNSWIIGIYQPLTDIIKPIGILIVLFALVSGIFVTLSGWLSNRMLTQSLSPFEEFIESADKISNGDYTLKLNTSEFSEMNRLKKSLETMSHNIQLRETEQREMAEQLIQSQKMEAIGNLAGGVAHDFNNILTAIGGFTQLIKEGVGNTNDHAKEVLIAVERASRLTKQLLAFSRKEEFKPETLSLSEVVNEMQKMLARLVGEDIRISFRSGKGESYIEADRGQLEIILVNLTVNAADAIRETGKSNGEIEIAVYEDKKSYKLSVKDNGPGIPEEIQKRVFEPFFTTKPKGKGTGMGLSTIFGIVEQNGAHIDLNSAPGEGTCFTISWPASVDAKPTQPKEVEQSKIFHKLSILFVDDEPTLLQVGEALLLKMGHRVKTFSNSTEALLSLSSKESNYDLLITDVIMPGMDGPTLAEKVKEKLPHIEILFISGYTHDRLKKVLDSDASESFLSKPFTMKELSETIKNIELKVSEELSKSGN